MLISMYQIKIKIYDEKTKDELKTRKGVTSIFRGLEKAIILRICPLSAKASGPDKSAKELTTNSKDTNNYASAYLNTYYRLSHYIRCEKFCRITETDCRKRKQKRLQENPAEKGAQKYKENQRSQIKKTQPKKVSYKKSELCVPLFLFFKHTDDHRNQKK